jgi:hypothetical protein
LDWPEASVATLQERILPNEENVSCKAL